MFQTIIFQNPCWVFQGCQKNYTPYFLSPFSQNSIEHLNTLPETNIASENRPGPKRKQSYSNHPSLGAFAVSFREGITIQGPFPLLPYKFSSLVVFQPSGMPCPPVPLVAVGCPASSRPWKSCQAPWSPDFLRKSQRW